MTSKKTNLKNKRTSVSQNKKKDILLSDKDYKIAEKLYKDKKYDEARYKYIELSSKYKKHKKIYKRLIECLTHDYTFKDKNKDFKSNYNDYVSTYKILCTKRELTILNKKLEEYKNVKVERSKSKFLLISLVGFLGIHKFIEKKFFIGFLYLFTFGFLGIGVIIDLINDYAIYEDDFQLDIFRYIISILILIFGIMRSDVENFYCFIIISIILMPIIYSKVLKLIPSIIKIIVILVLVYFGFKEVPVISYIPTGALGNWVTSNENTNLESLNIKLEKTTIKFNDREKEVGINEYDSQNDILTIVINENKYYKFILNLDENKICLYTESGKCIVSFEKDK